MTRIKVREGTAVDAGIIARMMNSLNAHEGMDDTVFSEAKVLAQAFGSEPAYMVLLAEIGGVIVGYATYYDCYDPDFAERGYWMVDLYVEQSARRQGVGRVLLNALSQRAVANGRASISWGVMPVNRRAKSFYESIGAVEDPGRVMVLHGSALEALSNRREI